MHYHISPRRNRESIRTEGLRLSESPSKFIWLVNDPQVAAAIAQKSWGGSTDNDVWAVDTGGLALRPDPHPGFSDAAQKAASMVVDRPIPPTKLILAGENS